MNTLEALKQKYPGKFAPEETVFGNIRPGNRIFISTACGEPQYLVRALIKYVSSNPKSLLDAEVFHVWTLGIAPYADEKFKLNFRHNSFFIGNNTRSAVNQGLADYSPVFLSQIPGLFSRGFVPIDAALIQTSMPDSHGFLSLGISVDITKSAVENAPLVIAQVNSNMPRVHGDTFIHIDDVDFIVPCDEPLLTFNAQVSDEIARRIGAYAARIINDGDTIQAGYGSIPNAILSSLSAKKNLGVHTELLSDGIVDLIKKGAVTNCMKSINRGKTTASFCMGSKETYDFLNDNPGIEFRQIDYTNNPLVIAQNKNMAAINSALQIDLTGQATAESLGKIFYSGIGGSADFMRGAILAPGGKTILVLQSTAQNDGISRIVPFLDEGAGVTINRGDAHYVVTEYGIAYLHGKNIRERAMSLIAVAHPKFRAWLMDEAKKLNLIYKDQAFIPGEKGEYPEGLETRRSTKSGLKILLRPVKMTDEPLLKDFFYSLSDESIFRRFISVRRDMPHERLQELTAIDYSKEMVILAVIETGQKEEIAGVGQYGINESNHTAEVAVVVRDNFQNKGIGTELLSLLTNTAKKYGLLGFTAEVLAENKSILHLFEKAGFDIQRTSSVREYELKMTFNQ